MIVAAMCVAAILVGTSGRIDASATERLRSHPHTYPTLASCVKVVRSEVKTKAKLTVATDNPVYSPWFINNSPSNGKGYESAVAYHIALTLGFRHADVVWYTEPYATSQLPGAKPFDFDIDEITYSKSLTTAVSFSISYFNLNQSIVALKGDRIVLHHTPLNLHSYLYGAQAGTPGLAFIKAQLKPTRAPIVYSSIALAVAALQAKRIDAFVVDVPDGQYMATQLLGGTQVAQFHTTGSYYALLLQKASPLVGCVDTALQSLTRSGELSTLAKQYLTVYNSVPTIKP